MEFHREQRVIFALAGTVPLPSPFPASGRLSIGVFPRPADSDPNHYAYQFYLKIIQPVSDQEVETRIARLEDLRAVKYRDEGTDPHDRESWTLRTADELSARLARIQTELVEKARAGVDAETELYPKAILYVPTSAPVLVRYEFGTTAGKASPETRTARPRARLACPPCPPPCCGRLPERRLACPPRLPEACPPCNPPNCDPPHCGP